MCSGIFRNLLTFNYNARGFYLQTEVPYKYDLIIIEQIFLLILRQGCVVWFGVGYIGKLENNIFYEIQFWESYFSSFA